MELRPFEERLKDFAEMEGFTIVYDSGDFVIFEDDKGYRFNCSGESLHFAMLAKEIY